MIIQFVDSIPQDIYTSPILISGVNSFAYLHQQYLLLVSHDQPGTVYEIRYQTRCSPFRDVLMVDNLLAVGCQEHFYLFDTVSQKLLRLLKLNGYFGHLYHNENLLYVSDSSGIHCIDRSGHIRWTNAELGVDGVIIHEFREDVIAGSGEFDPPGDWKEFYINMHTGR